MKTTVLALMLAVCGSLYAEKYTYCTGFFQNDGDVWTEYKNASPDAVHSTYAFEEEQLDYYIISNDEKKIAVPKEESRNFLVLENGAENWKLYLPRTMPAPKKPRLSAELREKRVRNYRSSTPFDGIHMYTSPFGYINTLDVTAEEAKSLLNFSGMYTLKSEQGNTLTYTRNDRVGYENFTQDEDTSISGVFGENYVKQCTYTFSFPTKASAEKALVHLKKHLNFASKGAMAGKRYKVNWLKEIYGLFDVKLDEVNGHHCLIVDVEYDR